MRKSVRTLFENLKNVVTFILAKVGLDKFLGIFEACTDKNHEKSPEKVGKWPNPEDKSGQKNSDAFSQKRHFLGLFCPFLGDLRQFA